MIQEDHSESTLVVKSKKGIVKTVTPVRHANLWKWADATGMGLSSSTKTTQVEMTKASSGLGPLMTNSLHSLHSQTKGVLLMTSCLGTLVYSTGHQSPCWYVHLPAGRNGWNILTWVKLSGHRRRQDPHPVSLTCTLTEIWVSQSQSRDVHFGELHVFYQVSHGTEIALRLVGDLVSI